MAAVHASIQVVMNFVPIIMMRVSKLLVWLPLKIYIMKSKSNFVKNSPVYQNFTT